MGKERSQNLRRITWIKKEESDFSPYEMLQKVGSMVQFFLPLTKHLALYPAVKASALWKRNSHSSSLYWNLNSMEFRSCMTQNYDLGAAKRSTFFIALIEIILDAGT